MLTSHALSQFSHALLIVKAPSVAAGKSMLMTTAIHSPIDARGNFHAKVHCARAWRALHLISLAGDLCSNAFHASAGDPCSNAFHASAVETLPAVNGAMPIQVNST